MTWCLIINNLLTNPIMTYFSDEYISQLDYLRCNPFLVLFVTVVSLYLLSSVPDFFDPNKILSGGDLSHYQVPHCIRVFFYFV